MRIRKAIPVAILAALVCVGCFNAGTTNGGGSTGTSDAVGDDVAGDDSGTSDDTGTLECAPDVRATWYPDRDGDGYGDAEADGTQLCGDAGGMMVQRAGDCDDSNADVHPGADELCNDRDDDCDGTSDADESAAMDGSIAPKECSKQKGVCNGATIAECNSDGDDYQECHRSEYGEFYDREGNEGWMCDDRDNDCDGETDEACCGVAGNDATPEPSLLGEDQYGESNHFIVPTLDRAPQTSAGNEGFFVGWAREDTVQLRHLAAHSGGAFQETELQYAGVVTGLTGVRVGEHYYLFVGYRTSGGSKLIAEKIDRELKRDQSFRTTVDSSDGKNYVGFDTAKSDSEIWVSYSAPTGFSPRTRLASIQKDSGALATSPTFVAKEEYDYARRKTEVVLVDGTPVVVWTNLESGELRGARFRNGGPEARFHVNVRLRNRPEPYDLFTYDGQAVLVYPAPKNGTLQLVYNSIGPAETGDLSGGIGLTGTTKTDHAPTAVRVENDRDRKRDELLVVWLQGSRDDPAVVAGTTDLESPETLIAHPVHSPGNQADVPQVGYWAGKAGTLWLRTAESTHPDLRYAPLSPQGPAICDFAAD